MKQALRTLVAFFGFLCLAVAVSAQGALCPSIVQDALDATNEACLNTGRNEACYGNFALTVNPVEGAESITFEQQGDKVDVASIQSLTLSSLTEDAGVWGVAMMQLQANIPDTLPGQNVTFMLFGDVEIENGVGNVSLTTLEVSVSSTINVRGGPSTGDAVVGSLSSGDTVIAVGRNADASWLEVELDEGEIGWVFAQLASVGGDANTLSVVDNSDSTTHEQLNPMQAFYFRSGIGDAGCAEAPESGIMIQTPEGVGAVNFTANDVNIALGSTIFIQASIPGEMIIYVVEGSARITAQGKTIVAPAGARVRIPMDANRRAAGTPSAPEPYDASSLQALPINLLPQTIDIAEPVTVRHYDDPTDDTTLGDMNDCTDDDPPTVDTVVDILGVDISTTPDDALNITVTMGESLGENDYSFGVQVILFDADGQAISGGQWARHDGASEGIIGAFNMEAGGFIPPGNGMRAENHLATGVIVLEFPKDDAISGFNTIVILASHKLTPDSPGITCDRLVEQVDS